MVLSVHRNIARQFLFVAYKMFDDADDALILNCLDRESTEDTRVVRIVRKAFPISASKCNPTQWTNHWGTECYVDALSPELASNVVSTFIAEVLVPAARLSARANRRTVKQYLAPA